MPFPSQYPLAQVSVVAAAPIAAVALSWAAAIFLKNSTKWRPYDVAVFASIAAGVTRAVAALACALAFAIDRQRALAHCDAMTSLFHALHTFEASNLATLSLVALLAARRERHLSAAHLVYHLCCLLVLSCCVGVASALAAPRGFQTRCATMPFELDARYNVFVLVLHALLMTASLAAVCAILCRGRRDFVDERAYDSIGRPWIGLDQHSSTTTFSSTNSRRPCIAPEAAHGDVGCAFETIAPVLVVSYLVYHLPVMVLCIYPGLLRPWPVAGIALWLGLVQDLLIPIALALVDSRFGAWVADVYQCNGHATNDKIPHLVGVDGKFRPFGSQPQSLEASSLIGPETSQHRKPEQQRFPITNGSLYTTVDGRLPIIHDYRQRRAPTHCAPSNDESTLPPKIADASYTSSDCDDANSITTEANGDFDFYQSGAEPALPAPDFDKINNNFLLAKYNSFRNTSLENFEPKSQQRRPVRRSHSKRSLENFRLFLEDKANVERASLERPIASRHLVSRSQSKLSDCTQNYKHKIKSVEYLPSTNASTWLIVGDASRLRKPPLGGGSVPDLKKIFISEYI